MIVTYSGTPAEPLVKAFGFALVRGGKGPLQTGDQLARYGSQRQVPCETVRHCLRRSPGQTVLVADSAANPVAAAAVVGKGRVVVWADDFAYWDFCAQRDKTTMKVASAPTTTALFKWLVDGNTADAPGWVTRLNAEIVERNGAMVFRYSLPVADAARKAVKAVPGVMKVVQKANGMGPPEDNPFVIHWLAAGGGGWASGPQAGVCAYGDDPAFPIKVMGHELTHCTTGPWPAAFNEAWASLVGMRAAEAAGFRDSARAELEAILRRLDKADPSRRTLDLMDAEKPNGGQNLRDKATWMLLALQKKYGPDFIPRFLALRARKFGLRKQINAQQMFELFAETSGDPGIWQWLKDCGTSARPPDGAK